MSLLTLEQFRQQLHYNPYHFWGWQNATDPVTSTCNTVLKKYAWQRNDALGRTEIESAIDEAERRLAFYLQYSVAPHFKSEVLRYPPTYDQRFFQYQPMSATGTWKPVVLGEGYVKAVGVEKLTLLQTVNIVNDLTPPIFPYHSAPPAPPYLIYLDTDSDNLPDTFQIGLATTITDPTQLAVYFSAADRLDGQAVSDVWRIQPLFISISGGVATLRGRCWMLGRPILSEGFNIPDLNPVTAANYVTSLEVYQRVCDPTGTTFDTAQAKFIWQTMPFQSGWWCFNWSSNLANGSTDPASQAYSVGRVGIKNSQLGIVLPGQALLDATTGLWNETLPPWTPNVRPPDQVEIRYLAGYPTDSQGRMDSHFQTVVARMAMAELNNRIVACDESNRELYRWQRDLALLSDTTEAYGVSREDLNNPFGTRRGHAYAWKEVKTRRLLRGVTNIGS